MILRRARRLLAGSFSRGREGSEGAGGLKRGLVGSPSLERFEPLFLNWGYEIAKIIICHTVKNI